MTTPRCRRGNCRKAGRVFRAIVPIELVDLGPGVSIWGTPANQCGGGAWRTVMVLCPRHEDRVRRFTRIRLREVDQP